MKRFIFSIPGAIAILGIIFLALFGTVSYYSDSVLQAASNSREAMQIIISLVILAASLFIILSKKYDADIQKWAYGAIGTVIGFWLPTTA